MQSASILRLFSAVAVALSLWSTGYLTGLSARKLTGLSGGTGEPSLARSCNADTPPAPATINDSALLGRLEAACRAAAEAGESLSDLPGQLARESCRVSVAAEGSELLPVAERVRRLDRSVVIVGTLFHCGKCQQLHFAHASGFAVGTDGSIATSYHVMDEQDVRVACVMDIEGRMFKVKGVRAARKRDDLAILETTAAGLEPLPLTAGASPGEDVLVLSHPSGSLFTLTSGIVSRAYRPDRRSDGPPWLTITAPFARGSSGAPVVDTRGNVVGVVSQTRPLLADQDGAPHNHPQMILYQCSPARGLIELITP